MRASLAIVPQVSADFRVRLGKSPPAKVPPMRVRLDPAKKPIKVKVRRYSPDQRAFLDKYISKLVEMDFFMEAPTAPWQAAPLLIPKFGSKAGYRLTIDLRPVNGATITESWPMPHIESELLDFAGSKVFATIDFVSGYLQLPLHKDSYGACGVVTPKSVYVSKRVLPGLHNAGAFFQSSVEPLFRSLRSNMKAWIDDFSLHASCEAVLLHKLAEFFDMCLQYGLFISARKSNFFARQLKWCGRLISSSGYTLDPANLSGLTDMVMPQTAGELAQLIYCGRWMSNAIPNFTELVAPLSSVLEAAYARSGRRTTRSIRRMQLRSLSWGDAQVQAFLNLQDALRNAVRLSYPDPRKCICVYTDASERFWSGVVTQVQPTELELPNSEQRHEPLAFLGSAFKGPQQNWSTFEKEGFAIFQTFEKVDYLLLSTSAPAHVFTDHRNLLFVFAPLSVEPALGRHIVSKVQRWALYLSRFPYVIEHVDGHDNVFADILTRWARGYRSEHRIKAVMSILAGQAPQIVLSADDVLWPSIEALRASQQSSTQKKEGLQYDESDSLLKWKDAIWIPPSDVEMHMKLLVSAHCGAMGHRVRDASKSILRESFFWESLNDDVNELVKHCLHCLVSRSGEKIPRPLAHALHGDRPNEVVHVDYLYMGQSTAGKIYLLLIRDDLSSYVWLWPTSEATADAAVDAISAWIAAFGSMDWLVSDQASHFKNELLKLLTSELKVAHHFTTAYSPWANGTVERACREVLRFCRALCSEWCLAPKDWPAVTECIQSVLNQSPLQRLGLRDAKIPGVYRTPLEVFTGHIPCHPLLRALPVHKYRKASCDDAVHIRQLLLIEQLQQAIINVHKDVHNLATASRERSVKAHNRKTNVQPVNFHLGDFVLVRRALDRGHKLQFKWLGPRRIAAVRSQYVFEVENLLNGKREVVHSRRLMLYRSDMDGIDVDPKLLKATEHLETVYQDARCLRDIRKQAGQIKVQVEWDGLPDKADLTWEPLLNLKDDIPDMLQEFLATPGNRRIKNEAINACQF